ncbi:MAG: polysaccharide biosynthesis tyrosine autokinase [Solirubrobacterales bacterium]|nr:polysaccharide biosynthesis tyrosine autokinase [Solirubrobacterales bacterium]
MELELRQLIQHARRWWWLIVLIPLISGAAAYTISDRQTPLYSATATLFVNPGQSTTDSSFNAVQTGQRLATTYQQLVVTEPVLQPVIEQLQLPYSVSELKANVSASIVRDTQLLKVSVSDSSPETAALIANAVATSFSTFVTTQQLDISSNATATLNQLIADLQRQSADLQAQIQAIERGEQTPPAGSTLDTLRTRANQIEQSLADLLVSAQQMEINSAVSQGQVFVSVPATAPSAPYAPRTTFYTALAMFLGVLIAVGAIALLEYLDNTVKPGLNFERSYGVPMLSVIGRSQNVKTAHDQIFVLSDPHSSLAEAVRLLRTNLEFAAATADIQSLSVTSSSPGDGKSTVAANLAVSMAQSGFTTILVDADLRRPTQHKIFEVRNDRGMTNLLTNPNMDWKEAATQVAHTNLWVLTSGPVPPNPADLLSSSRLPALVKHLEEQADVIIFDTPPILAVSDPLIVATQVDGVLLVASSGATRIDALQRSLDALPDESVRTLGIVLNKHASRSSSDYYYTYSYYGPDKKAPAGVGASATPAPTGERGASPAS